MIVLEWAWRTLLDWHLPVLFAFLPLIVWELHYRAVKRRARRRLWAEERAALRSLRTMHPGPRSIP